jgi:hypothetical protein
MKKLILFLVLTVLAVGGIFAQEKYDGSSKNTIAGTILSVSYERSFNQKFSAGIETGMFLLALAILDDTEHSPQLPLALPFYVDAFARWYPFKKAFYAELGLGFATGKGLAEDYSVGGFLIKPELGWKLDIGQPGKFVLDLGLGMAIAFGGKDGGFFAPAGGISLGYTF